MNNDERSLPNSPEDAPQPSERQSSGAGDPVHIPVIREQIVIDKHVRETGQVVVHIEPQTRRETVNVPLVQQEVDVQRVPINRVVDALSGSRQVGDVTIVPIYEEVLVVEKRLVLKEEIHIRRRQMVHHDRREVELRGETAHVLRAENEPG